MWFFGGWNCTFYIGNKGYRYKKYHCSHIRYCNVGYIYAKVKVVVYNHIITDIELLEHAHERGAKAESIVKTIVEEQRADVDAVSGATNSSMVIEKACVNALIKHKREKWQEESRKNP